MTDLYFSKDCFPYVPPPLKRVDFVANIDNIEVGRTYECQPWRRDHPRMSSTSDREDESRTYRMLFICRLFGHVQIGLPLMVADQKNDTRKDGIDWTMQNDMKVHCTRAHVSVGHTRHSDSV